MNKKLLISLGLIVALSAITATAYAETTIYRDGLGRMHFLGKDAASNTGSNYNYSNSAEQDLTRKLYEEQAEHGMINDTSYDQHPLKNYENTFPDSRFGTSKYWKTKYANNSDDSIIKANDTVKTRVEATKGTTDTSGLYMYGNTNIDESNVIKKTSSKKHWWNKN